MFEPMSKNNTLAVKLKINICPCTHTHTHALSNKIKGVKQTCSDVLDVPLTADNNGWKVKAAQSREK